MTVFDAVLRRLCADLEETLRASPGCVGPVAPQVHCFQRIGIVDVSARPQTPSHGRLLRVNPMIVAAQGEAIGREGCLSVPDYTANGGAPRASKGWSASTIARGYEARAVPHELDHLDGLRFLNRLVSRRECYRTANPGSPTA